MLRETLQDALFVRPERFMAMLQLRRQIGTTQTTRFGHGSTREGEQRIPGSVCGARSVAIDYRVGQEALDQGFGLPCGSMKIQAQHM